MAGTQCVGVDVSADEITVAIEGRSERVKLPNDAEGHERHMEGRDRGRPADAVVVMMGLNGGGHDANVFAKDLFSEAIGDIGLKDADHDSLEDAGDQGMRAKNNVHKGKIECVEKAPMRRWSACRRDGPPKVIEGKPVAAGNA